MAKSFHSIVDSAIRGYQTYQGGLWQEFPPYITIRDRSLTYEFFSHFHPYVPALIARLNDGGFAELQDSDTLYLPQPNPPVGQPLQPLTVQPGTTRATLLTNITATIARNSLPMTAGTPVTLPDGATVVIAAGSTVVLPNGSTEKLAAAVTVATPGSIPASSGSGIQWATASGTIILPDGASVNLLNGAANAVLSADGSTIDLPANTPVALQSGLPKPFFFQTLFDPTHYNPDWDNVNQPGPLNNLDFTSGGAYSIYNWELFFHAPLMIAIHLSQNQQFQDAQNWFHYIFNPTDNSAGPTPERFWKVQPFQYTDVTMIEQILLNLSQPQDPELAAQTQASIYAWQQNPFQPWVVASFRPTAYMLKTVTAYLDNLIAWGDSLFQQYTIETINEATQIYILAANILGDKPQAVPQKGTVKTLTYNALRAQGLDAFSNALVDMEVDIPFDIAPVAGQGVPANGTQILASIGQTLYFCIPQNDQMLAYWDTVADRLFKIHNSLNLQGVFQQLPLYDPPIDPALLVRAAAAGLDISSVVSGLNQPLPLVRFQFLLSKATEICQEVKSLGGNLLSAIEKQDNESLALLRAQHENVVLGLGEMVKYSQWQEAIKSTQGLEQSLANATQKYTYYQLQLGRTAAQISSSLPQLDALDEGSLENGNFSQADATSEPQVALTAITPDISTTSLSVSDGEVKTLSTHEVEELTKLGLARDFQIAGSALDSVSSGLSAIPEIKIHAQPMGVGETTEFGGMHLHDIFSGLVGVAHAFSEEYSFEANKASKVGTYSRREMEWVYQSNVALGEINQIYKQLRGAQIREAIAKKEYDNHQVQMQNAQEVVDFLNGANVGGGFAVKETTTGFYAWMKREVKALYSKAFQLAFDVAKKAERALQSELGNPTLTFIQYNYQDGTEGLLAGEKLMLDLKTMDMAYHDLNQREYELTKHVSLLQADPLAVVQLRATGTCSFTLPEELFNFDGPSHYFRRIKSVALTLPCVAGPYTSVNCTLSLQKSTIRTSTNLGSGYAREGSDDIRFNDYYGTLQSIVTSSAQSDSGLFETNLKDERYLPFENAGIADSQWQLTLPSDVRQFDFDTITDVILHLRYTAREGGEVLKAAAVKNLQTLINNAQTVGSVQLFSIRHQFPTQWAKFQSAAISQSTLTAELNLALLADFYPFWAQGIAGSTPLRAVEFFAEMLPTAQTTTVNLYTNGAKTGVSDALMANPALGGLLTGNLVNIQPLPSAVTDAKHPPLDLFFDNNSMENLWLAITWGK